MDFWTKRAAQDPGDRWELENYKRFLKKSLPGMQETPEASDEPQIESKSLPSVLAVMSGLVRWKISLISPAKIQLLMENCCYYQG